MKQNVMTHKSEDRVFNLSPNREYKNAKDNKNINILLLKGHDIIQTKIYLV